MEEKEKDEQDEPKFRLIFHYICVLLLLASICTNFYCQNVAGVFILGNPSGNGTYYWSSLKALLEQHFDSSPYFTPIEADSMCKMCNFTVRNEDKANSSPRDVIVAIVSSVDFNFIVFMRTLRTVKSKCSVVFIMDSIAISNMRRVTREYIKHCGCQIINSGNVQMRNYKYRDVNLRFYLLYMFLLRNRGQFDRVISIDVFDSAFQGDPFNVQINRTHFNLIDEGIPYKQCRVNTAWFENSFGPLTEEEKNAYFPCAGYLGSSEDIMFSFLELYFSKYKWKTKMNDQGLVGYLALRSPLKYLLPERRQTELVYHNARFPFIGGHHNIGDVRTMRNENAYASIIHHYYKSNKFMRSLKRSCPRESIFMNRYVNKKGVFVF